MHPRAALPSLSLQPEIPAVVRVAPVAPTGAVADTQQELQARAEQFVKGQFYYAHILSTAGHQRYDVDIHGVTLRMSLGPDLQPGQTILLKYVGEHGKPSFAFSAAPEPNVHDSTLELSPSARQIQRSLQQHEGLPTRYLATVPITQSPANAATIAQDLRAAVTVSGLFYESHLAEFAADNYSLAALKQEPQNQPDDAGRNLLPQQLAVLEHQRLSWQGQAWPGQPMQWDVWLAQHRTDDHTGDPGSRQAASDSTAALQSQLTLTLPRLGKITVRLNMRGELMQLDLRAVLQSTQQVLQRHSPRLATALQSHGQTLQGLSVGAETASPEPDDAA